MNFQEDPTLQLPFCGDAVATLAEARRRMDLAASAAQDDAHDFYLDQALQLYREGRALDREMASGPAYADLQEMWVDLASDTTA